jgi:hypothetical protein
VGTTIAWSRIGASGTFGEEAGELDREAGLAGAAGAEDRQQARVVLDDKRDGREELALAADEGGGRRRQVDRAGGA